MKARANIFERYGFNPFQFTPPDSLLLGFHGRQVPYFAGCNQVLDLGAGRGFFLRELRKHGIRGIGVENHEDSLAVGRQDGVEYIAAEIFSFFESDEGKRVAAKADGVYCAHVIEHFEPEEVFELFRLVKTHCAANVRCRFITNNPADIDVLTGVFLMDLTHKRLYPPDLLAAMAKSQGFQRASTKVFLGLKLGKRAALRRLWERPLWRGHKWLPNLLLDCS